MVPLAYRLTSIVPLAPLDRPLSTCFRHHSLVLDVSWVKVHEPGSVRAPFAICIRVLCLATPTTRWANARHADGTILSRRGNRLPEATRHARCHPIGFVGRGGDVCIHRPTVFRSNKSSSLSLLREANALALGSPCIVRFFRSPPRSSPGNVFYSVCVF